MRWKTSLCVLAVVWTLAGCRAGADAQEAPQARASVDTIQPDILFVLVDDLGIDQLPMIYPQACPDPVPLMTPTIDALAETGVVLDNLHVLPICSPTRAAMLSGLEPIKRGNGIGQIVRPELDAHGFDLSTPTFLRELKTKYGYDVAFIGKWHLNTIAEFTPNFAEQVGADVVEVLPSNHDNRDYFNFETFNGDAWVEHEDIYSTQYITDRAIECMETLESPKICFVSYTAVHSPWHIPPEEWTYSDWSGVDPETDPRSAQKAMLEALDFFLAQLLATVDNETFVFFVSDNGTPADVSDDCTTPMHQAKGTLYEGGIRVPAIANGPAFLDHSGVRAGGYAMAIDVFPTMIELAGGSLSDLPTGYAYDFVSFWPHIRNPLEVRSQRSIMFSEIFSPNRLPGHRQSVWNMKAAISRNGFKYIRDVLSGKEEFYDLGDGETDNLIGKVVRGSLEERTLTLLRVELDRYSVHENFGTEE